MEIIDPRCAILSECCENDSGPSRGSTVEYTTIANAASKPIVSNVYSDFVTVGQFTSVLTVSFLPANAMAAVNANAIINSCIPLMLN